MLSNINIFRTDDTIFAFDPVKRCQHGIGGDDKVGVYIVLQLLTDLPTLKAVFFRDEEIGCRGSAYSISKHPEWYHDCGFVIGVDRRGNSDVVTVSGGVIITSEEFLNTCDSLFTQYKYKDIVGICSDVDVLASGGIGVSAVNFSCGYHEPHTHSEIVSIRDVNVCYNLIYDILMEHGDKVFKYSATVPTYKKSYRRYGSTLNESVITNMVNDGASTPILKRQPKLFGPMVFGQQPGIYDNFVENDVVVGNKKLYNYTGIKSLVLTGEGKCTKCKSPISSTMFYLPYEGRIYCTKCNDYVNDTLVPALLQYLEVEDRQTTFVYSLYSAGWLNIDHAVWNPKITSWVSNGLPF
jgi:hypothetical protein